MSREKKVILFLSILFVVSIAFAVAENIRLLRPTSTTSGRMSDPLILPKKGIGVINVNGPLRFSDSNIPYPSGVESILDQIKSFGNDNRVKALLLRVNSPGGTVGSSQEIYHALRNYKEKTNNPIVVSISDMGASGAYYLSLASDSIFANEGSLVGSIGVILGNLNFEEFAKEYGLRYDIYKSGDHKDIMSSWRPTSQFEKQFLNSLVDNVHQQFVAALIEGRSLPEAKAKKLANGLFYSGQQAKELGLIDEVGTYEDAIRYTAKLANLRDDPLLINKAKPSVYDFISIWREEMGMTMASAFRSLFSFSAPVIQ